VTNHSPEWWRLEEERRAVEDKIYELRIKRIDTAMDGIRTAGLTVFWLLVAIAAVLMIGVVITLIGPSWWPKPPH
jgi:hypothetical protein